MEPKRQSPDSGNKPTAKNAGGIFIAGGGIAGVLLGGIMGQPSAGFLGGLTLGSLVALAVWLFDR